MPIFDTSDIRATGLTINGTSILSGSSNTTVLTVSGGTGTLLTVTDNPASSTLFSIYNSANTQVFAVTNSGTSIGSYLFDVNNQSGTTRQVLTSTSSGVTWTTNLRQISLVANLANAGDTGTINQTHLGVGYNGTIVKWFLTCYPASSVTVDIWKVSNGVPTVSNTITGSAKPSTASARFNSSSTLTGWNTTVSDGDYFMLNIDSNTAATYINLQLVILI